MIVGIEVISGSHVHWETQGHLELATGGTTSEEIEVSKTSPSFSLFPAANLPESLRSFRKSPRAITVFPLARHRRSIPIWYLDTGRETTNGAEAVGPGGFRQSRVLKRQQFNDDLRKLGHFDGLNASTTADVLRRENFEVAVAKFQEGRNFWISVDGRKPYRAHKRTGHV